MINQDGYPHHYPAAQENTPRVVPPAEMPGRTGRGRQLAASARTCSKISDVSV